MSSDRGAELRPFDAELLFADDARETEGPEDRYLRFLALIDGTPRILVHPLHGAYLARVRNARLSQDADEDGIRVTCEFVPFEAVSPTLPIGPGAAPVAGPEAVAAASAQLDEDLAELLDLSEPIDATANATATATAWSEDDSSDVTAARVEKDLAAQVAELDLMIEDLELETLEGWTAYRSAMILRDRLGDAAAAVVSPAPRLYSKTVEVGASLQVLLSQEYGAAEGARQKPAVVELNAIRNPAFIPAGTVLKFPVVTGSR